MNEAETREVAIIGGGLAGLLTCRALVLAGVDPNRLSVIDSRRDERGSDNPGAMVHPFPGRSLEPRDEMLAAFRAASNLLDAEVIGRADIPAFRGSMVRPLLPGEVGEAFESSWRAHRREYPDWLDSTVIDTTRLGELGAFADTFDRAICYGPAYCVDLSAWMRTLRDELRARGVDIRRGCVESVERRPTSWRLEAGGGNVTTRKCVLAVGSGLNEWFPELNIQPTAGALLVVERGDSELKAAISAGGHIAPVGEERWVAGATWWHDDEFDRMGDADAAADVAQRVRGLIPSIADKPTAQVWRGVRAVHANDRRPLVGEVAGLRGLYVSGGFGSKGLLWTPLLASRLASLIVRGKAMPPFADTSRLGRRWWIPSERIRL